MSLQSIVAFLVQGFFAWRVKVLTSNIYIATLIGLSALTQLCTASPTPPFLCLVLILDLSSGRYRDDNRVDKGSVSD